MSIVCSRWAGGSAWYAPAVRWAIVSPMSSDVAVIVVAEKRSNPPAAAALSAYAS
jgi:hypothetical protein